jgi:hypothetical protein
MSTRNVQLVDQSRNVLATARVTNEGDYYGGTIDLRPTPANVHALFDEFEEIVNGQMFVFLDAIQEKIGALRIKAVFDDGSEMDIKDLQVFPSTGDVSFRPAGILPQTARPV